MTDEQRCMRQPLSMTRRYRRGLILTGVLCVLAMLAAATVLFSAATQNGLTIPDADLPRRAAAYEAKDTHSRDTLPTCCLRTAPPAHYPHRWRTARCCTTPSSVSYIVDVNGDIYAAHDPTCPTTPTARNSAGQWRTVPRASPARARRCSLETHYYAVRIDLPEGAQVLRVGEDVAQHRGPERRHPAAAVRRSRADFARCHAVQLVADPPHGAAYQPSGRASGHD